MKIILFFLAFLFLQAEAVSQRNARDSLKNFTVRLVQKAMSKEKIRKIAIAEFTGLNKEPTVLSQYISELIAIYAENLDSVTIIDMHNLKSILKENNLDANAPLTEKTIVQIGKLADIDAVISGKMLTDNNKKDFQLLARVLSTSRMGTSLASAEEYFTLDNKMIALLGPASGTPQPRTGTSEPQSPPRIQIPPAQTNSACATMNLGDYCFSSSNRQDIEVKIFDEEWKANGAGGGEKSVLIIKPNSSECLKDYKAGLYYYRVYTVNAGPHGWPLLASGSFLIEQCKSKSQTIR